MNIWATARRREPGRSNTRREGRGETERYRWLSPDCVQSERPNLQLKKSGKRKREKEVDSRSPKAKRNTTPHLTIPSTRQHKSWRPLRKENGIENEANERPPKGRNNTTRHSSTAQLLIFVHPFFYFYFLFKLLLMMMTPGKNISFYHLFSWCSGI